MPLSSPAGQASMEVLCVFLPFHVWPHSSHHLKYLGIFPTYLDLTFLFRDQWKSWVFWEAFTICCSHRETSLKNAAILAAGICCLKWSILLSFPMWGRSSFTELGFISITWSRFRLWCDLYTWCFCAQMLRYCPWWWVDAFCFEQGHQCTILYVLYILMLYTLSNVYNIVSLTIEHFILFLCVLYMYAVCVCAYMCLQALKFLSIQGPDGDWVSFLGCSLLLFFETVSHGTCGIWLGWLDNELWGSACLLPLISPRLGF